MKTWFASPTGLPGGDGSQARPWDLQTALGWGLIQPGDVLNLRGGIYTHAPQGETPTDPGYCFRATISGSAAAPITIQSFPGELAQIDGGEAPHYAATARPALQLGSSGSMSLGAYLFLKNVRIFSSSTKSRLSAADSSFPTDQQRSDGVYVLGIGDRIINCIFDNNSAGISSFGTAAIGQEFYGNVLLNNGWQGTPNFHGHNFYVQGQNANNGLLKNVTRNISLSAFEKGGQFYGSSGAEISHLRWGGNLFMGLQGVHNGFLVGTRNGGASNRLQDNEFFDNYGWGSDLSFYYQEDPAAYHSLKAFNNYFVDTKVSISSWKNLQFTDNVLINRAAVRYGSMVMKGPILPWQIDRNTYQGNVQFSNEGVAFYDLPGWRKATGFDAASTVIPALPTANKVVVQNNGYDSNRAHVFIYNWSQGQSVVVDVGGLMWNTGDTVELRNVQDYFFDAPIQAVSPAGTLTFDMRASSHTIAAPFGTSAPIVPKSFPDFGAFVLVRTSGVVTPPPPPPPPTIPVITAQPVSQTWIAGSNVTFSVGGTGTAPLSFQWKKDSVAIPGATNSSLGLLGVSAAMAGSYTVDVSNIAGMVTSAPAILTVTPIIVLTPLQALDARIVTAQAVASPEAKSTLQFVRDLIVEVQKIP